MILPQKLMMKNDKDLNQKLSKFKNSTFLTNNTKQAFVKLRQMFIKLLIFNYFDLKCYIWIEINISTYTIYDILNQLTSDIGQQNPIAYFFQKIILTKN